jgi:carbonic anhydrase/acetyltransferase-like protein (isoleucine patch superfamily)
MKMKKILRFLRYGSLLKTWRINVKYFGFSGFFKPRVIIARNVKLDCLKGSLRTPDAFGCVNIGFKKNPGYPNKKGRTIFHNEGNISIKRHVCFGYGSALFVGDGAEVIIGDASVGEFTSFLICKSLSLGFNVMISWDCQFMDNDGHSILDAQGAIMNYPRPISLGDSVWICSRAMVMKGAGLSNNSVLAAGSFLSKRITEENCIVANNEIIKSNINFKI